jgi:pimeloyl-ACP methyl ester carboxylesterase
MSTGISYEERGQGPPLVFLHGVGGDAACWLPQLEAFGEDHRAIAWNMPGYGSSAPLPAMTFAALSNMLLRLFDQLEIERAHLVGHSMGGMVAQEWRPAPRSAAPTGAGSASYSRAGSRPSIGAERWPISRRSSSPDWSARHPIRPVSLGRSAV